jgi:hypothetical protein
MSRRSGRDPNASSFNLFTGDEADGSKASIPRPSQHPLKRGSSLILGDPDMPDDRFSHIKASSMSSSRIQPEHAALAFQPLGPIPSAYSYDGYPEEDVYEDQVEVLSAAAHCGESVSERPVIHVTPALVGKSTFTIGDPDLVDDRFAHHTHRSNMGSSRAPRELAAPIGSENRRALVRSSNDAPRAEPGHFFSGSPSSFRRESSNSWARNDNQNSGNFLADRPTTRVVAPPGGRNSMGTSFGWQ